MWKNPQKSKIIRSTSNSQKRWKILCEFAINNNCANTNPQALKSSD